MALNETAVNIDLHSMIFQVCAGIQGIAVALLWRAPAQPTQRIVMIGLCATSALWALACLLELGWLVINATETTYSMFWLLLLGPLSRLNDHARRRPLALPLTSALACSLPLAALAPLALGANTAMAFAFWQIAVGLLCLVLVENALHVSNAPPSRIICVTATIIQAYIIAHSFSVVIRGNDDPWFWPIQAGLLSLGAVAVTASAFGKRHWRGEMALSRKAVLHSTVLMVGGIYLVSTSAAGEVLRLRSGLWGPVWEMVFLCAAMGLLLVLLKSASLRARMMVFIGKHFFRLKYDYRQVWLNFIRTMAGPQAKGNLGERTLRATTDAVDCAAGTIWTLDPLIDAYVPVASLNQPGELPMIPSDIELTCYLARTGWIIDIDECAWEPQLYDGMILPPWLRGLTGGWVVVPLIHNRNLEGFIVLCRPRSRPKRLGWEDLDILKTLGAQGASYLAEERASRQLSDTQRLAEFNRRFTFVVHDIKNVVSQMSMLMQNAERYGDDPLFQQDMLTTIGSSVDRLKGMLIHLKGSEAAQQRQSELLTFSLAHVAQGAVERWRRSGAQISFHSPFGGTFCLVRGIPDRLSMVLDHLIGNAVEASGPHGRVRVEISTDGVLEVIDNGPGMSPAFIRDELFRPFRSSKPHGSGIGAFQASRLVREMNGRLEVESTLGVGTTMRIVLQPVSPVSENNLVNINAVAIAR